jgi:hypothetical protein
MLRAMAPSFVVFFSYSSTRALYLADPEISKKGGGAGMISQGRQSPFLLPPPTRPGSSCHCPGIFLGVAFPGYFWYAEEYGLRKGGRPKKSSGPPALFYEPLLGGTPRAVVDFVPRVINSLHPYGGEIMKRIVICVDGTWNSPEDKNATNVITLARALAPEGTVAATGGPITQVVFYDWGVGTGDLGDKIAGGALGLGLDRDYLATYAPDPTGKLHRSKKGIYDFKSWKRQEIVAYQDATPEAAFHASVKAR